MPFTQLICAATFNNKWMAIIKPFPVDVFIIHIERNVSKLWFIPLTNIPFTALL